MPIVGGEGLATAAHFDPVIRAMKVCSVFVVKYVPTAKQLVVLTHDTPAKSVSIAPVFTGLTMSAHFIPFQWSTSVLITVCEPDDVTNEPTAKQLVALTHVAAAKLVCDDFAGFGPGDMIVHEVPFQRSISQAGMPFVFARPTAKQFVADVHATPYKRLSLAPAGFGLGVVFHPVAVRCMIDVRMPTLVRL